MALFPIMSSLPGGLQQMAAGLGAEAANMLKKSSAAPAGDNTTGSLQAVPDGTLLFKDVYDALITNVNQTDAAFQADLVKAAAGELDNPHQLLIDSQKAIVALQLVISVRNKALEAYNDIIRMQI